MVEGQKVTLQCAVQQAAPVGKLHVVFYKGQTKLASNQSTGSPDLKQPQDETFTLDFTPSREDDGVAFWCQASLDLDVPGGRPVVRSSNMTALVHCRSEDCDLLLSTYLLLILTGFLTEYTDRPLVEPLPSRDFSITVGDPLNLSCRAEGNPAPSYQWTLPSNRPSSSHSADFIISSSTSSDGGWYTCLASNTLGNVTVTFQVHVKGKLEIFGYFYCVSSKKLVVFFLSTHSSRHWSNLVPPPVFCLYSDPPSSPLQPTSSPTSLDQYVLYWCQYW